MRSKLLLLLLVICSLSSLSAQLYDSRGRYLQRKADDFEKIYKPRTLNSHSSTTRSSTIPRSYSRYRAKTSNYNRRGLSSDRFYDKFRDPEIYNRYNYNRDNNTYGNEKFKFQCFCSFPIDIASLINWFGSEKDEIAKVRQEIINGYENEYLKEMNKRYPSYPRKSNFKDAQKDFFERFSKRFNYRYQSGKRVTYGDDQMRFTQSLSERIRSAETALKPYLASSKVVSKLNEYRSQSGANLKKRFGHLKINGTNVRDLTSIQHYDFVYRAATSQSLRGLLDRLQDLAIEKQVYEKFNRSLYNINDYVAQQYINQYNNEYNLEKRFALMSAYLVDMNGQGGAYRPPSNKTPPVGYKFTIPYDYNDIYKYYRSKSTGYNSSRSLSSFANSLISFEKAKALVAIDGYGNQVKQIINGSSALKQSTIDYLKSAIPVNYELNTIKDAVEARIQNRAFQWSELNYMPSYQHQSSENPEVIMTLDLEKRTLYSFMDAQFIDMDMGWHNGLTVAEYKMHKGIGEVLKDLYSSDRYWVSEGATMRYFLQQKGVNVPSSLSNYNLGKLFDFGGGNTNTLTIEFSDFAKKYITNFHHGDGNYGKSLFTDIVKFALLKLIADRIPVNFAQATKPCPGDPVPNPEIAPQTNSGMQGGLFGTCTRDSDNSVCAPKKRYHGGVDLKNPYGAPVYAMFDGVARKQEQEGGAGHHVSVSSTVNGKTVRHIYFHLQEGGRASGTVKAGDIIGYQGVSGNLSDALEDNLTVSHVHIKVEENGKKVDPLTYLTTKIDPNTGRVTKPCK